MKLAIMQAYFMPYLGYFQLITSVDKFILYEHVSYRKKTWMNHNYLLLKNGVPFKINIPVQKHGHREIINNIRHLGDAKWQQQFFSFLHYNYSQSAYYREISNLLRDLLTDTDTSLHQLNSKLITGICDYLDINTTIISANEQYLKLESELAQQYAPEIEKNSHFPDRKTERIIRICRNENATTYINPQNGLTLYNKDVFGKHQIQLQFLKTELLKHPVADHLYVQNFSIVDTLMHFGKSQTQELLQNYTLL